MDTIFAQATARGKAGIAIIRVSGPDAFPACRSLCGDVPPPGLARLRVLRSVDGAILDEGLVLSFGEGASYTGEASVEFHVHGGPAVCTAVLDALARCEGLREAEPGEFTRRALENGRLDLTRVEGLADLIDAETEAQRRLALRTFSGDLAGRVGEWRAKILRAMALLEATIDFADEEVPVDIGPEVQELLNAVSVDLSAELAGARMAERIRDGFEVAIVGRPNVGKSTLLNALAGRRAALTSEVAGTTRDVIEVRMDLDGLPVTLLDTAGLREAQDVVEAAGVALARERAEAADLRLFLVSDASESLPVAARPGDVRALAKGDLRTDMTRAVSGVTGAGLDWVLSEISDRLRGRIGNMSSLARRRQVASVGAAKKALDEAMSALNEDAGPEFVAEHLRCAAHSLSVLIGDVDVEHVLGEIFSSFCIGK